MSSPLLSPLAIGPTSLGYISLSHSEEIGRLVLCPVDGIAGNFWKLCCVRFQRGVAQIFATGAKNPFSTIHIFDFELNRPPIAVLRSKHSPMLADPGQNKLFLFYYPLICLTVSHSSLVCLGLLQPTSCTPPLVKLVGLVLYKLQYWL